MCKFDTKEGYEEELNNIQNQIKHLDNAIKELQQIESDIQKDYNKFIAKTNTEKLANTVAEITDGEVIVEILYPTTKTTPIIDKFSKSKKKYLLLNTNMEYYDRQNNKTYYISFLVLKTWPRVRRINSNLTISDLKKASKYYIQYYSDYNRLKPLIEQVLNIFDEFHSNMFDNEEMSTSFFPLDTPVLLGAQTFANQTGFGNEYNGEDLVYEGTKYGDTTKFLIIGIKLRKNSI